MQTLGPTPTTSVTHEGRPSTRPPRAGEPDGAPDRWAARPVVAWVLRVAIVLLPAIGATSVTWQMAHWVPRPAGLVMGAPWWAAMLALGTACYVLAERAGRRLLPLSALLRVSLVFPDRAPSRYRIALRSSTTRHLRETVDRARGGDLGDTLAEAVESALVLIAALNRHDRITRGHSERVRAYADMVGEQMGLDRCDREHLRWAALLHDIGKLAVPSEILNKPGRLTDQEFEIIKTHPEEGERLVAPLLGWLGSAANAVGQHHERFDGKGYPRGLAGEQISLSARIVAVVDTFDVITSARSYKRPMSAPAARREIASCAGTQFDPVVTRALLDISIGRLWLVGGPLTWLTSVPLLSRIPIGSAVSPALGSLGAMIPSIGNVATAAGAAALAATAALGGIATVTDPPAGFGREELASIVTDRDSGGAVPSPGGSIDRADRSSPSTTAPPAAVGAADQTAVVAPSGGAVAGSGSDDGGAAAPPAASPAPTTTTTTGGIGGALDSTVGGVTGTVDGVVGGVTGTVDGVVGGLTGGSDAPLGSTVGGVTDTVDGTVDGVTDTVDGTVGGVTDVVDGLLGGLLGGLFGR
jgi:putative nucleotidyltransferase with HDIG domain